MDDLEGTPILGTSIYIYMYIHIYVSDRAVLLCSLSQSQPSGDKRERLLQRIWQ